MYVKMTGDNQLFTQKVAVYKEIRELAEKDRVSLFRLLDGSLYRQGKREHALA